MSNNQPRQTNSFGFEALLNRLYTFVDNLEPSKRKSYGIGWLVIAILLAGVASVPLGDNLRWVAAVVGWPAGVILFALALSLVRTTSIKNWGIFSYKERVPPKKRVSAVIIGLVIVAILLISVSRYAPLGVGGTVMIFAALLAYQIIRRTPEELALAAQGIPDPREFDEEEEEEV